MSYTDYDTRSCDNEMCFEYKKTLDNVQFTHTNIIHFFSYFIAINIVCLFTSLITTYISSYIYNYRMKKICSARKYKNEYKKIFKSMKELTDTNIEYIDYDIYNNKKKHILNKIKYNNKNCFERYVELIELRQFLENRENVEKVLNIYKNSNRYLEKTRQILNDKYRCVFLDKTKFLNYYRGYYTEEDVTLVNNEEMIHINLNHIYSEEQVMIDRQFFDIENKDTYYPLGENIFTSFATLNVVRWLIEIGFYDIILPQ